MRYPNSSKSYEKPKSFSNRGMSLENDINASNQYYLTNDIAVIFKKPTPIQIVKVDYPKRSAAKITDAYFEKQSTTDYNGVYKGRYIDFEAKSTKNSTSFPLANISSHQIEHLKNITITFQIPKSHEKLLKLTIGHKNLTTYYEALGPNHFLRNVIIISIIVIICSIIIILFNFILFLCFFIMFSYIKTKNKKKKKVYI